MFGFRQVWLDLRNNVKYLIVATIVFVVSMVMGMTSEGLSHFLSSQINSLEGIVEKINESSNPTLVMFLFIFINNAVKAVLVIFLGAFFGIYPLFFLVVNGLVLGYVIGIAGAGEANVTMFEMIFKLLLPHGIIEIPTLILVAAYGLKLGRLLISTLSAIVVNQNKLAEIGIQYKVTLKRCGVIAVYATVLLLIASIIESTFTMWLSTTIN